MAIPRFFVSHSHNDQQWCTAFVQALRRNNLDIWYDKDNLYVGTQWIQKIEDEIQQRNAFLLILSPDALQSRWVQDERSLAMRLNKQIITVHYRKTQIPGFLGNYQVLEAIGKSAEDAAQMILDVFHLSSPSQGGGYTLSQALIDCDRAEQQNIEVVYYSRLSLKRLFSGYVYAVYLPNGKVEVTTIEDAEQYVRNFLGSSYNRQGWTQNPLPDDSYLYAT